MCTPHGTITRYKLRVAKDLTLRLASPDAMLSTLDPLLSQPIQIDDGEFRDLVTFVRDGLLDQRAQRQSLCPLVPVLDFEGCRQLAK
jgi:hypothetical protein